MELKKKNKTKQIVQKTVRKSSKGLVFKLERMLGIFEEHELKSISEGVSLEIPIWATLNSKKKSESEFGKI